MKKIDIKKIEQIKEKHFNYCKTLKPFNHKKIDEEVCYLLCCENPFNFEQVDCKNKDYKYIKKDYYKYVGDESISYESQYTSFRTQTERNMEWNGVKLIEHLGIDVCPYCGLNYISTVNKENGKCITTATFDHYLPKSKYKFLALNLYNLIPVCKNCNSTFKGAEEKRIINPYFDAVEDNITFNIKNLLKQILNNNVEPEIEILYDPTDEKIENHCNILLLYERYNYFKNLIKSLIYKRCKYNKNYLKQIKDILADFSILQFEKSLIVQDILSKNEPFLKFKKDIWKQLSSET